MKGALFIFILASAILSQGLAAHVETVVKVLHDEKTIVGETPYWDAAAKTLYYVDVLAGDFVQFNTVTRTLRKVNKGDEAAFIIPYAAEPGSFIVGWRNEILKLDFETEAVQLLANITALETFNDAYCDARGRLFAGTFLYNEAGEQVLGGGSLYRLDGSTAVKVAEGFSTTNGMAWSNDKNESRFFLNDSEGKIYAFDYDLTSATLSNKRVLIDCDESPDFVPGEFPDGMVSDNQGFIWVALWKGGRIVKIDVDTARVVDEVRLNVTTPTSLAPGEYEGNPGFFVTTATLGIPTEQLKPDDGKVLHIGFQGGSVYSFVP